MSKKFENEECKNQLTNKSSNYFRLPADLLVGEIHLDSAESKVLATIVMQSEAAAAAAKPKIVQPEM